MQISQFSNLIRVIHQNVHKKNREDGINIGGAVILDMQISRFSN